MDISKCIDLHSYSSSKGFLGYIDHAGDDARSGADYALDIFESFLSSVGGEVVLFTTMAFKGSGSELKKIYGYEGADFESFIESASGFISDEYDESCSFRVLPLKSNDFRQSGLASACYIIMALGGVCGHLFIFSKAASVIVYPHDDTGFGVISVDDDNLSSCFFDFFNTSCFNIHLKTQSL